MIGCPFEELKKDCPLETTKYTQRQAIGSKGGDSHQDWATSLLSHRRKLVEGLELDHGKRGFID